MSGFRNLVLLIGLSLYSYERRMIFDAIIGIFKNPLLWACKDIGSVRNNP
jgi:hypothetical protein